MQCPFTVHLYPSIRPHNDHWNRRKHYGYLHSPQVGPVYICTLHDAPTWITIPTQEPGAADQVQHVHLQHGAGGHHHLLPGGPRDAPHSLGGGLAPGLSPLQPRPLCPGHRMTDDVTTDGWCFSAPASTCQLWASPRWRWTGACLCPQARSHTTGALEVL